MENQIVLTIIFLTGISLLLVFNEMAYRQLGLKGEITRKFAHFTATLSTITFPYLFTSHWYVLLMACLFLTLLYVSRNRKYLKSIHDIDRVSVGSYLLPLSIYITFLVSELQQNKFLFILPMFVLAICDPVAGILGINFQRYNYQIRIMRWELKKTWIGSLSFFVSCFIVSLIALYFHRVSFDSETFYIAFIISFVTTLVEMFSWRGTDNLFIPMSVMLLLILFL
jgi:phytol kinase